MSDAIPLPARPNLGQYKQLARELQHACRSGDPAAIQAWASEWLTALGRRLNETGGTTAQMRDWIHREAAAYIARRWAEHRRAHARPAACTLTGAQFFLAREHGFASWPKFAAHVEGLSRDDSRVSLFERAVDAIVAGDTAGLQALLRAHPRLTSARSTRDHRSTLLHYVSANGVEDFRQKTPPNIVEITRMLLDAGADVNAASDAYGGGSTALGLVATSIHPEQAGVQIPLMELLLSRGAEIEQPGLTGNQHSAVHGCLANGQGAAARFFAERGAHMNLEDAAGVGRLDVVRTFFDVDGRLKDSELRPQMEQGFRYACGYGYPDVARYLLDRGVDPGAANNRGQTGLHWAMYGPHPGVVDLLLERGAPVNARDAHQGTPLDWAVRFLPETTEGAERDGMLQIIEGLARAGGQLTPAWFEMEEGRRRALAFARADPKVQTLLGAERDVAPNGRARLE